MMASDDAPGRFGSPAVLILTNSRARGSLTAVRSLGSAGWRVGVGAPGADGLAARSRWCTRRHDVPRPRGDGRVFLSAVVAAVERGGYDLVVGGADDWAAALARWHDEIPCRVGHPPGDVVDRAIDKLALARVAEEHGLRAPATRPATPAAVDEVGLPVIVKCRRHWAEGLRNERRIEATLQDDREGVRGAVGAIRDAGLEPLLQEPVEGRLSALIGVVVDGRLRGRVAQRAIGTWPTPNGVSSRARTVTVDEGLAAKAESMLTALGWTGLVELQFLQHEDEPPVLIDLNGRYFGSMALAVAAGVDLPVAGALVAMGRDPGRVPDGRPGVSYAWLAGDLRRAVVERRGGLVRDVLGTLGAVLRANTTSILARRDPGPMLWLAGERLRRRD